MSQSAASRAGVSGRRISTTSPHKATAQLSSQKLEPTGLPENSVKLEKIRSQLNAMRQTLAAPQGSISIDKAAGKSAGPAPSAATLNRSFEAIPFTGSYPSDSIMATGPSDLLVAVNRSFRIYNKTGGQLLDSTLSSWFSNVLPSNQTGISVFDPWVIYDRDSGRFVLLALALRKSDQFSRLLISVSDNNTAAGGWCNWSLDAKVNGSTNTTNWADYAKIGNSNNAIIITANMFRLDNDAFQYSKIRFLPKAALYNTNCPGISWWDHWDLRNADNTPAFTIQPAHGYNSSNTNYLVNTTNSGSGNQVTLWKAINNSNSNPQPTLTRSATLNVGSYAVPPLAEQPGTSTRLHTGDARLLNAVWRGGGLWTTHSTACTFSGDSEARSCLRYYQINPDTGSVLQNHTWGAPGAYYYYPAITADPSNNAWLVFNRSSKTEYASIRHTARRGSDPINSLQGSSQLRGGQGCYVKLDSRNRNRWGDYNGMAWDPSTGGAWIFSQFAYGTSSDCSSNVWRTQVGELAKP
jgi:hypothetical protein